MSSTETKNTFLSGRDTVNQQNSPPINKPIIVGGFSIDGQRQYLSDRRNCKYLYKNFDSEPVQYDLNEGIQSVIRTNYTRLNEEKINPLLYFILENIENLKQRNEDQSTKLLSADVVCYRGVLRLLMCTPYEFHEPWVFLATNFKGTIYIYDKETDKKINDRLNRTENIKKVISYGFKFEQLLLTDDPLKRPETNVPVNENEAFYNVYTTDLNRKQLLYAAEMDGINCEAACDIDTVDLNDCKFIELKVKLLQSEKQKRNFLRYTLRNWWCQCFLANIKEIVVGYRDEDGIVRDLSTIQVPDIPNQVNNIWSPAVCMEFCDTFLKFVANEMKDINNPYTVYRFDFDPEKSKYINMQKFENKNEYYFLPQWYIDEVERQTTK